MSKTYTVRIAFDVTGYVETEMEGDSLEELRAKVEAFRDEGAGDEAAEICWDTSREYRVVSVQEDVGPRHLHPQREVFNDAEMDAINGVEPAEIARLGSMENTLRAIKLDCLKFLEGETHIDYADLIQCIIDACDEEIGPAAIVK